MKFNKPSISIAEQLALLKRRGMTAQDDECAQRCLRFISYFRLRAYCLVFEEPAAGGGEHIFRAGTSFDDVLDLYVFDRELRLLVLDAIERVEVAFRASWANHMAMKYGPHGYLEQQLHRRADWHAKNVSKLMDAFKHSTDTFAKRYRRRYRSPELPPVWMVAEVLSFGSLSKWIRNLHRADKKVVAEPFGMSSMGFDSACHHLAYVRNICAHHGRLWNRQCTVTMTAGKLPRQLRAALQGTDGRRLYSTLTVLGYLLPIVSPGTTWPARVVSLLSQQARARLRGMGIPEDWQAQSGWQLAEVGL